mmetsp:Transcript_63424/g.185450  ORF Transcript_63424/g.185450 Transcript_63424/m.185450 type:complete len:144 (+) Transcript_63424:618-1049(+)
MTKMTPGTSQCVQAQNISRSAAETILTRQFPLGAEYTVNLVQLDDPNGPFRGLNGFKVSPRGAAQLGSSVDTDVQIFPSSLLQPPLIENCADISASQMLLPALLNPFQSLRQRRISGHKGLSNPVEKDGESRRRHGYARGWQL